MPGGARPPELFLVRPRAPCYFGASFQGGLQKPVEGISQTILELTRAHLRLADAGAARTILAETERVLELLLPIFRIISRTSAAYRGKAKELVFSQMRFL